MSATIRQPDLVVMDVKRHGARTSESMSNGPVRAKNSAALLSAVDALEGGEGVVRIPGAVGDYWCDELPSLASGQQIVGDGVKASRLRVPDPDANGLTIIGASASDYIVMAGVRDLALIGSWNGNEGEPRVGTGVGLKVKWAALNCFLLGLHIYGWPSHGCWWEDTYTAKLDLLLDSNGGDGFHGLTNCNYLEGRLVAVNNDGAGVSIVGGTGNDLFLDCERNTGPGVDLRYVYATKVSGDLERNGVVHGATQAGDVPVPGTPNLRLHFRDNNGEKCDGVDVTHMNLNGQGKTPIGILVEGANLCEIGTGVTMGGHTYKDLHLTSDASRNLVGTISSGGNLPTILDESASTAYHRYNPDKLTMELGPSLALMPRTAGPPAPTEGQIWYRGDQDQVRVHDGTRVRILFSGVEALVSGNPPSIAAGATGTFNVTVAGAALGDRVLVTPPDDLNAGLVMASWWVSAVDTVTVRLFNSTGSAIDQAAGSWRVIVVKA